jgi:hypothetical protein
MLDLSHCDIVLENNNPNNSVIRVIDTHNRGHLLHTKVVRIHVECSLAFSKMEEAGILYICIAQTPTVD